MILSRVLVNGLPSLVSERRQHHKHLGSLGTEWVGIDSFFVLLASASDSKNVSSDVLLQKKLIKTDFGLISPLVLLFLFSGFVLISYVNAIEIRIVFSSSFLGFYFFLVCLRSYYSFLIPNPNSLRN